jgi:hypothetical protein
MAPPLPTAAAGGHICVIRPKKSSPFLTIDEPVKSQKPDGFEKSSIYGAQISAA